MPLDIAHQLRAVQTRMIAHALVMHVTQSALDWLFIMHLHSIESCNHFPTGGNGSGQCNTKLPALMVTDTIADILARFDPAQSWATVICQR